MFAARTIGPLLVFLLVFQVAHADLAVVSLHEQYRQAWLHNDDSVPQAVMSLFAEDASLLPHHGDPIVSGRTAISEHWFPGGRTSGTIDRFEQRIVGMEVLGDLGYVYGRFELVFTLNGETSRSEGNQLMVARREGGSWKIVTLIWNDPPN